MTPTSEQLAEWKRIATLGVQIVLPSTDFIALVSALEEAREALKPYQIIPPISPPKWKKGMKVRYRAQVAANLRKWADILDIPSGDFVNEDLREAASMIEALVKDLDDLKSGKQAILPQTHEHAQNLYTIAVACLKSYDEFPERTAFTRGFKAGREAGAKCAENEAFRFRHEGKKYGAGFWQSDSADRMKVADNLAVDIRALPIPTEPIPTPSSIIYHF